MSEDAGDDWVGIEGLPESEPTIMFASSNASFIIPDTTLHPITKSIAIFVLFIAASGFLNGLDYASPDSGLVQPDEFERMQEAGDFLESAQVFGKHAYGTPRQPVEAQLAAGRLVILDIDVQGAQQVRASMPEAFMLFILPPSDEELRRRLEARARDDAEAIERRFSEAQREIELATTRRIYDAFVTNESLESAVEETSRLVNEQRAAPGA